MQCRWSDELVVLERIRALLDTVQNPRLWFRCNLMTGNALRLGPTPATEAIERIETANWGDESRNVARLGFTATLLAMVGRFDEARARSRAIREYLEERGLRLRVAANALGRGPVEDLAGDLGAADRVFAEAIDILRAIGEKGILSTLAGMRAVVLYRMGRREEMQAAVELAKEAGAPNDIATQASWRTAAAQAAADEGHLAEAERIIGEAVDQVEPTDFLELRAGVFEALAHVEGRAGRPDGWKAALDRALAEHDRKGNLVGASRIRDHLAAGAPEPVASA
jgi:hypothetical protein